jgi:hypothetical protein
MRVQIRVEDRPYAVDDLLQLEETDGIGYTGRKCARIITHIIRGPFFGLRRGWVMISIRPLSEKEKADLIFLSKNKGENHDQPPS